MTAETPEQRTRRLSVNRENARRMRLARKRRGLTQLVLMERLGWSSPSRMVKLESGSWPFTRSERDAVSAALGVDLENYEDTP